MNATPEQEPQGVTTPAAPAAAKPRRTTAKSGRRRAREVAVQGLYRWLMAGGEARAVEADIREVPETDEVVKADRAHFDALLSGGIEQASVIDDALARHVDRPTQQLSPIEHAVLMVGVYELMHCLDVPYRVVINEAVELAKTFGGTDGHRYVNGVLDKCAHDLRPAEVARATR